MRENSKSGRQIDHAKAPVRMTDGHKQQAMRDWLEAEYLDLAFDGLQAPR
jgi:hypothetical protein